VTSAAKAGIENKLVIAAVNRCATQNQLQNQVFALAQVFALGQVLAPAKSLCTGCNAEGLHKLIFSFFRRFRGCSPSFWIPRR
jgi:hypothetical protein